MAEETLPRFALILQGGLNCPPRLEPYQPDSTLNLTAEFQRHTCNYCKKLILELRDHAAGPSNGQYGNIQQHHDGALSTLANSSASCRVCAIIMNQIICDRAQVRQEFTYYRLSLSPKHNSFCVWLTEDLNAVTPSSSDIYGEFALYCSELPTDHSWLDYGVVYTPMLNELSVSSQPSLVSRDYPWHDRAIDKIRAWMMTCESHDECHPRNSTAIPKRVLKIADDSVYLHIITGKEDAQKEDQRYVALSYRWGNDLPLKLTRATLDKFMQGCPISKLPATLQDAVRISQKLCFKFIWIDALCIIQDDARDWAEQSAQMAEIYRQSSLNLCAADSAGCGSGMVEMAAPYLMEIAAAAAPAPSTNSTRMVVLMGGPIAAGHIDVSGCGLQSRGWVFQEGLCSPRGLYISRRHGLWWDCRTMVDAIDASEPIMTGDTDHAFNPRTLRRSFPQAEPPANSLHQNLSFNWYDWIMSYTLRNLTRQTDRLPAVAGLASYAFSLSGMTYAAGLWKEDILRGLTWRRGNSGYAERAPGNAPTWSWASVTGPIHYDEFFTMRVDHRGEIKKRPKLDLEITGTTIHEVRPGTFGNVQGGEIEATGILRNAATMLVGTGLSADWYLDLQPAGEENQFLESCQVLRLAMAYRNKQNSKPQVYFLIVRNTGEGVNEYQRVGRGYIELRYDQHPNRSKFSYRGCPSPKSELPEQGIWEQAERVTLTLV